MQTTEQKEYVYGVYAMNGYEAMHELKFRTTDRNAALKFSSNIDAMYKACVVVFEYWEIVPEYMQLD